MTLPNESDPVAAQYERWIYPEPWPDLTVFPFESADCHYDDLRKMHWALWPAAAAIRDDLRILVAGCGSMAAACYAYRYSRAQVTGIDLSSASLAHEERLKERHSLDNLTLRQMSLEAAKSLGSEYDFIASAGVLHHMRDPVAGLRALGEVLAPDGVISLMVYARYGRAGVYMMQDLFRILDLGQTSADVQAVKEGLNAVGPNHPVRNYLRLSIDLGADTGLVDTFLHRQDRAYTVGECLDLVRDAGLAFQGWDENIFYHPDLQLPPTHPFRARLEKLAPAQQWAAMELLHGTIGSHFFHVCRSDRDPSRYRISFEGDGFLDAIPVPRVDDWPGVQPRLRTDLVRAPFPRVPLDAVQQKFFAAIDGQRTLRECLRAAGLDAGQPRVVDYAGRFLGFLWRIGYMMFRLP
ncbi:MAG TPA: class I SAM-dependent methyltransferase [Gemmataceae bacterium]|jgi:SAM-dependent methyltransferase|nr:class I SAM-dependent methyltransferase [Gemmataceae bacterium]